MLNISLGFVLIALTVLLGLWDLRWSQGVCLLLWAALLGGRVLLDGTTSMLGTSPSLVAATTLFGIIGIVVFLRRSTSQAGSSGQQGAPQAPCRVGEQRAHAITWHVVALRSRLAAQRALPLWLSRRLWVRAPTPTPMATVSRAQQAKAATQSFLSTLLESGSESDDGSDDEELPSLDGWFADDGPRSKLAAAVSACYGTDVLAAAERLWQSLALPQANRVKLVHFLARAETSPQAAGITPCAEDTEDLVFTFVLKLLLYAGEDWFQAVTDQLRPGAASEEHLGVYRSAVHRGVALDASSRLRRAGIELCV